MLSGTLSWLKQTVTIYPYSSINSYGEYSFGTGVSTPCRIESADEQVINEDGAAIFTTAKLTIDGSKSVNVKDKVVLPNGDDRLIAKIEDVTGTDGTSYLKVLYV